MEDIITATNLGHRVQKVRWFEISSTVEALNPSLYNVIQQLEPADNFSLFVVRYPFGEKIVNNGKLCLPNAQDKFIPINDPETPYELRRELSYSSVPLGLTLNKSNEIFVETKDRIIPLSFLKAGSLIGLLETISTLYGGKFSTFQSISAGARSVFMLPKVSDANMHKRLCRYYNVSIHPPQNLWEHCDIFSQIAKSHGSENSWYSDVLFFGKEWFSERINHLAWHKLIHHLYVNVWHQCEYLRSKTMVNLGWEIFASKEKESGFKGKSYTINTVKHLAQIASQTAPAFQAAGKSEDAAPIKDIEDAYVHIYGLKDYYPIIMHLNHLYDGSLTSARYYSLSMPTTPEISGFYKPTTNIISELRDIKSTIEFISNAQSGTSNEKLIDGKKLSYFHTSEDEHADILSTKLIPNSDPKIIETYGKYDNREFPSASPFMRGCIKID